MLGPWVPQMRWCNVYMGIRIGCIQGVRLERVFVMDDVSNRVYSGSLYILNPIDPFLFLANKKISCAIHGLPTISFLDLWSIFCQVKELVGGQILGILAILIIIHSFRILFPILNSANACFILQIFSQYFLFSKWTHVPFLPFSLPVEKSNFTHKITVSLANVVKSRSFEKSLLFRFPIALMLVQILISTPSARAKNEKLSLFVIWFLTILQPKWFCETYSKCQLSEACITCYSLCTLKQFE